MICKLSIADGSVHFCSKFIKSKHRIEEADKHEFIYSGQMGTRDTRMIKDTFDTVTGMVTGNLPSLTFRNPSNTNSFYWGGKILSLYETHLPHCLDPYSLETLGLDNLNGSLSLGNAGVHFRIDPVTMNLVLFSLKPGVMKRRPTLQVFEFDRKWSLMKKMEMHIPDLNYAHDFLLFPSYYLFHITPFTDVGKWTAFQILSGWTSPGESMRYYPDKPSRFVVIPRDAKSEKEVICFDTDPCHIFHFGTAEEINEELKFNCVCLDEKFNMTFAKGVWLSNTDVSPGLTFNYTLNLSTRKSSRTQIDSASAEFPSSHPYRNGQTGTKFIYLMANDRNEMIPYRDLVKLDTKSIKKSVWNSDGVIGEPVFAPRHGYAASKQGAEDDGYVLVQLYHPDTHKTDFCILDARCVEKGPVARIKLKHHVPYGFHGTFTPEVFLYERTAKLIKSKL
ncbi:apocarotenoid-15,15'-oxygenase-like isoform X2 [Hydractinia symbiolongicarpus]|nr:apocarotenoid-15,15'-oxygenase-like isoform X2 [Hydractinia symbiolongicarpus]